MLIDGHTVSNMIVRNMILALNLEWFVKDGSLYTVKFTAPPNFFRFEFLSWTLIVLQFDINVRLTRTFPISKFLKLLTFMENKYGEIQNKYLKNSLNYETGESVFTLHQCFRQFFWKSLITLRVLNVRNSWKSTNFLGEFHNHSVT